MYEKSDYTVGTHELCEHGEVELGFSRSELGSLLTQLFSAASSVDTVSVSVFPTTAERTSGRIQHTEYRIFIVYE